MTNRIVRDASLSHLSVGEVLPLSNNDREDDNTIRIHEIVLYQRLR